MELIQIDGMCERCGAASEVRPYTLSESITYRGREIHKPWLCQRCFVVEKKKWWKARDVPQAAPR